MMFNQYPYLNVNDLNLDYILSQIKVMMNEVTNFVSINAIKYADPIQWDITRQYEKNTVVIDPVTGTAYISVAPVPAGVALTRPEYWTVVFDLGSFVTRAAQNFTSRYEQETTLTATFPSNTGEWLVWGDVLYKALTNITAGDTYVVGGNIEHFTIEDLYNTYLNTIASILALIGDLQDLTTSDTSSIVNAINSVLSDLNLTIGDLANLTTSDTSDIVHAINSVLDDLNNTIGDLSELNTPASNIVEGINAKLTDIDFVSPSTHIFVDGINGNDDNDGLSSTTAKKTLDAAMYLIDKGITNANISILEGGNYRLGFTNYSEHNPLLPAQRIANVSIHFANYGTSDVYIEMNTDVLFYNCRINIKGNMNNNGTKIRLYRTDGGGLHSDFCQFYLTDTYFETPYTFIGGALQINDGCGFYNVIVYMCNVYAYGTLNILGDRVNNYMTRTFNMYACCVDFVDVKVNYKGILNAAEYSTFYFRACIVAWGGDTSNVVPTYDIPTAFSNFKYVYGIRAVTTDFHMNLEPYDRAGNVSTTGVSLIESNSNFDFSTYTHTYTMTIPANGQARLDAGVYIPAFFAPAGLLACNPSTAGRGAIEVIHSNVLGNNVEIDLKNTSGTDWTGDVTVTILQMNKVNQKTFS